MLKRLKTAFAGLILDMRKYGYDLQCLPSGCRAHCDDLHGALQPIATRGHRLGRGKAPDGVRSVQGLVRSHEKNGGCKASVHANSLIFPRPAGPLQCWMILSIASWVIYGIMYSSVNAP